MLTHFFTGLPSCKENEHPADAYLLSPAATVLEHI